DDRIGHVEPSIEIGIAPEKASAQRSPDELGAEPGPGDVADAIHHHVVVEADVPHVIAKLQAVVFEDAVANPQDRKAIGERTQRHGLEPPSQDHRLPYRDKWVRRRGVVQDKLRRLPPNELFELRGRGHLDDLRGLSRVANGERPALNEDILARYLD